MRGNRSTAAPIRIGNMSEITVRPMMPEDWTAVSKIYLEGIATEHATFQTNCPPYTAWDASHTRECRLVVLDDGVVAGWAALHRVDPRWCYRGEHLCRGEIPGQGTGLSPAHSALPRGRTGRVLDAAVHGAAGQRPLPGPAPEMRLPRSGPPGAYCPGLPRPLAGHLPDGAAVCSGRTVGI